MRPADTIRLVTKPSADRKALSPFGSFIDRLLQTFEDRRPGLTEETLKKGDQACEQFFLQVYEGEPARLKEQLSPQARDRVRGQGPLALLLTGLALATGCAVPSGAIRFEQTAARDGPVELTVPGLLACDDGAKAVTVDPRKPLHLLVHGCNSSAARFKTLAKVFQASGQQTVCYSYDDRARLEDSSGGLARAIEALKPHLHTRELVVLGHSQGGLVARRALVEEQRSRVQADDFKIRLVTVSSPFDGIQSSRHCSYLALHVVSFGLTSGICQLIAGIKWLDIHPRARMIRLPGTLVPTVTQHLKVVTDETDSCRHRGADGRCAESDFVFTVEEQHQMVVDADPRLVGRQVKAGHVEIVGETGEAPVKLIKLLQDDGVLATPPAGQEQAFAALVERLYAEPE